MLVALGCSARHSHMGQTTSSSTAAGGQPAPHANINGGGSSLEDAFAQIEAEQLERVRASCRRAPHPTLLDGTAPPPHLSRKLYRNLSSNLDASFDSHFYMLLATARCLVASRRRSRMPCPARHDVNTAAWDGTPNLHFPITIFRQASKQYF